MNTIWNIEFTASDPPGGADGADGADGGVVWVAVTHLMTTSRDNARKNAYPGEVRAGELVRTRTLAGHASVRTCVYVFDCARVCVCV